MLANSDINVDELKTLDDVMNAFPHVRTWIDDFQDRYGSRPIYYGELDRDARTVEPRNLLYITKPPIFVHIYQPPADETNPTQTLWMAVEPGLDEDEELMKKELMEIILEQAPTAPTFSSDDEFEQVLTTMIERYTILDQSEGESSGGTSLAERFGFAKKKIKMTLDQKNRIEYIIIRDLTRNGPIEPLLSDEFLEDIHSVGLRSVNMDHKVFGTVLSNIRFRDRLVLGGYLRSMSERIGRPVSDSKPIVDAALLDGSRINIIFSDDVSLFGPSFTIRKFAEETISFIQLIQWGTLSSELAAYLWMCYEFEQSMLVSGETASGKTTTLNATLPLIPHHFKKFSAEDTPEVKVPHKVWQRLVTRESKNEEAKVDVFDLLKAALRSRPKYIIIGEIRGKEGSTAFQAMQTGHAVLGTFHASSILKMIQRFTGDPINVPARFFDNLNLAVFQTIVQLPGGMIARRITGVDEILGYNKISDGILTRGVFEWDPVRDKHFFRGRNQSYILEERIAPKMGLSNKRLVYEELDKRAQIIQRMVDRNLTHYEDVKTMLAIFYGAGLEVMGRAIESWVPEDS